jgi:endonuclease YncB( thermonuclease family)
MWRRRNSRNWPLSLNHKRRIFRPGPAIVPHFAVGLPPQGLWLAAACGVGSLLAAAWLLVGPSNAPTLAPPDQRLYVPADRLKVIDGDTLLVGDHVVRLWGIVAPARGSVCQTAAGASGDCGIMAANALATLLRGAALDCTVKGHDEADRPVAECRSSGIALSEAMVRDGWARALDDNAGLRRTEAEARAAARGVWRDPRGS